MMAGVCGRLTVSNTRIFASSKSISIPSAASCHRLFSVQTESSWDVIIAGGGMVGTALATAIAKNSKLNHKKVLLLEGGPEKKWTLPKKFSNRVSALSPETQRFFSGVGAWKHIEANRFQPVRKMQIWDANSDSLITFHHDDFSKDLAYIVENDVILAALTAALKEVNSNVTVVHGAKMKSCEVRGAGRNRNIVTLDGGEVYECALLVGADGFNSRVRAAMNKQYFTVKYDQMGLVATLKLSEGTDNTVAWQRFLPTGPIALLPLSDDVSSLVWSTSIEEADRLMSLPQEAFVDAVNDAFYKTYPTNSFVKAVSENCNSLLEFVHLASNRIRQLPPGVKSVEADSRAAFPLGLGHATNYVAPGVALVGDAAHRVHPLAGQGVNLGFGDVVVLTELLAKAVYEGRPSDNWESLAEYETTRQRHNVPTMLAIHILQKLYGTTFTPTVALRSVGLQLTNAVPPLKRAIMAHAGS